MSENITGQDRLLQRSVVPRQMLDLEALLDRIDATGLAGNVLPAEETNRKACDESVQSICSLTEPREAGELTGRNLFRDTFRFGFLSGLAIGKFVFDEVTTIQGVLEEVINQSTGIGMSEGLDSLDAQTFERAGQLICRRGERGLGLLDGEGVGELLIRAGLMCRDDGFRVHHMYGFGLGVAVYSQAAYELDIARLEAELAEPRDLQLELEQELRRILGEE